SFRGWDSSFRNWRTSLPPAYSTTTIIDDTPGRGRSVRPGLLVPGTIERRHSPTDRKELSLRVRLAGDAVPQLVEERALQGLREQHAGVAKRQRRPLRQLARELPCPIEEAILGKHLGDGSPLERFAGTQLLPREQHVARAIASDDRGPDDVLAVA